MRVTRRIHRLEPRGRPKLQAQTRRRMPRDESWFALKCARSWVSLIDSIGKTRILTDLAIKIDVADVVDNAGSAVQECGTEEENAHHNRELRPFGTVVTSAEDEAPCCDLCKNKARHKANEDLPAGQNKCVDPAGNLCILASSQ